MVNRPPGREPPQKATLRCEQGGPLAVLVTSHHRLGRDFGGRKAHHRQDLSSGSVHPRGSTTFAVDSRSLRSSQSISCVKRCCDMRGRGMASKLLRLRVGEEIE